jgi:hypothetical protein
LHWTQLPDALQTLPPLSLHPNPSGWSEKPQAPAVQTGVLHSVVLVAQAVPQLPQLVSVSTFVQLPPQHSKPDEQAWSGLFELLGTVVQMPCDPESAQELHVPAHALLQQ